LSVNIAGVYSPGTPSTPCIISITGSSVRLEWTAPESDGGSEISGYVLTYGTPGAHRALYSRETIRGSVTNCTVTEKLFPGRTYHFAVAAENEGGIGNFSNVSTAMPVFSDSGTFYGRPCQLHSKYYYIL